MLKNNMLKYSAVLLREISILMITIGLAGCGNKRPVCTISCHMENLPFPPRPPHPIPENNKLDRLRGF